jgi:20S proteasome alpha/beta subunit
MTTIVYRAGILAADSRAYAGYNLPLGAKRKIRRLPDGTLMGCSSNQPGVAEAVQDWAEQVLVGGKPEPPKLGDNPSFTLLVVGPDGRARFASGKLLLTGPVEGEFFAIGSGAEAAYGALHMGASAGQAVEIACRVDVWSELPVAVLRHEEAP